MITVDWANAEKTIILWQNDGAMTTKEYQEALTHSATLAKSVGYPVGVIMDMRRAGGIPKNSFSLSKQVIEEQPANMVITIVVSNSTFWQKIWLMFARFRPSTHINIQFADTMDAAHTLITQRLSTEQ